MAGPDASELVDALVELSFVVQGILARVASAHDLSVTQLRLGGILRDRQPGTVELAGYLGLEKSSASGLIERARRRGLVRQTSDERDGRAVRIALTPRGHAVARRIAAEVAIEIEALCAGLPPADRERLTRLATGLVSRSDDADRRERLG